MARPRAIFACQTCGFQSASWLGRCPDCNAWNSLVEEQIDTAPIGRRGPPRTAAIPAPLTALTGGDEERWASGIGELDRVLGGGVVPGSVVLVGGDPGIGKSTLALQLLAALARTGTVLYVSGEESPQQIKLRADRLGLPTAPEAERLIVLPETCVERILEHIERLAPVAIAVDSIQTVFTEGLASAPGSIGQVRESAAQLVSHAKRTGRATVLIGHVTKEGALAGPRVLEHMVDTVLYFEGDRGHPFRILRAAKNRFGSTNEIGVFDMKGTGLQPVENPSALFLAERPQDVPGSVVVASMEGTRPILVEVQALVSPSALGTPRRTTLGLDPNRVALLVAILEKKLGAQLFGHDIFVNVAGGVRIDEPAADLGVAAAVASSFLDRPIDPHLILVGEVGLAGEVRAVSQIEPRLREAAKLGFRRALVPDSARRHLPPTGGIEVSGVASVAAAWEILF